jgi:hypothetical protein
MLIPLLQEFISKLNKCWITVRLNICRRLPQLRLDLRIRFRLMRGAVAGSFIVLILMSEYIRKTSKRFCVLADKIMIESMIETVSISV